MSHNASGDDAVSNLSRLAISSIKAPAKQQIHSIHRACVRNDRPAAPELPGDFENMRAAAQPFLITENKVPVERFGKRDHLRIGQSDLALAGVITCGWANPIWLWLFEAPPGQMGSQSCFPPILPRNANAAFLAYCW